MDSRSDAAPAPSDRAERGVCQQPGSGAEPVGGAPPAEPVTGPPPGEPVGSAPPAEPAASPPRGARTAARGRPPVVLATILLLGVLAISAVFAVVLTHLSPSPRRPPRPTGIPANVSTSLAATMQLSPVPAKLAPGFTLTDQAGRPVSLASFRGREVVLTFMDSHCTDVCPIVSREFIDAEHALGAAASRVVFLAVNVNPYHLRVSDVAAFSREQQLDSISSWHFLTGPLPSLRTVWSDYQVAVMARGRKADVIHTSLVYFIDPAGHERYVIAPMDYHTSKGVAYLPSNQLVTWAHGIALIARDVLSGGRG